MATAESQVRQVNRELAALVAKYRSEDFDPAIVAYCFIFHAACIAYQQEATKAVFLRECEKQWGAAAKAIASEVEKQTGRGRVKQ